MNKLILFLALIGFHSAFAGTVVGKGQIINGQIIYDIKTSGGSLGEAYKNIDRTCDGLVPENSMATYQTDITHTTAVGEEYYLSAICKVTDHYRISK